MSKRSRNQTLFASGNNFIFKRKEKRRRETSIFSRLYFPCQQLLPLFCSSISSLIFIHPWSMVSEHLIPKVAEDRFLIHSKPYTSFFIFFTVVLFSLFPNSGSKEFFMFFIYFKTLVSPSLSRSNLADRPHSRSSQKKQK